MKNIRKKATSKAMAAVEAAKPRPEVTAVLLLLCCLFFGLALGSYGGLGADGLPAGGNLMGSVGRYAAFLVLQFLGLTVGYYLALTLVWGVIWFTDSRHDVSVGTVIAYLAMGALLAASVDLGAAGRTVLGGHAPGGAVGELLGGLLASLFSVWGARLVSVALVVLLLVVATPRPLLEVLRRAGRAARWLVRGSVRAARFVASARGRSAAAAVPAVVENPAPVEKKRGRRKAEPESLPADAAEESEAEELSERLPDEAALPEPLPAPAPIISRRVTVETGGAKPHEIRVPRSDGSAPAADVERKALADVAAALTGAAEDDIEQVIEAAKKAGLFEVSRPTPAPEAAAAATLENPSEAVPAPVVVVEAPKKKRAPRKTGTIARADGVETASFQPPGLELLADPPAQSTQVSEAVLHEYATKLAKTLADYGIEGQVTEIHPGPVVTTYEFRPAPGTKLSRIASLENDVAMAMAVTKVRIVAPIPGKNAVGFEVPNPTRETVWLKELMADEAFARRGGALPVAIGKDLTGKPYFSDLAKMPHLMVAGATGTGKSVFINSTLLSLLYRQRPDQMKLILVDPKHVELIAYDGIPHLLLPVVSDMRKAAQALRWAVAEMERRYQLFAELGARQLTHYNQKVAARLEGKDGAAEAAAARASLVRIVVKGPDGQAHEVTAEEEAPPVDDKFEKLPSLVIVIDELAELMTVAAKEVEGAIQRLAQKGRAAGIHLIVATQRPSVDVITGTIKANFPTRVSFKVSSKTDSRTVLDQNGADQLLGLGDMLLLPPGASDLIRIQAAFVSDDEIERVTNHLKAQGVPEYDESIVAEESDGEGEDGESDDYDEKWDAALELVIRLKQASISKIQRYLGIGYNRSARIVERMEREGLVGPGSNPREKQVYADRILARLGGDGPARGSGDDRPSASA